MKKVFFSTWMLIAASLTVSAQGNSGLGFNYQAVVRGANGFVLTKQNVELKFSLMPGQQATPAQASWVETHSVVTDAYGTVGVTVGKGTRAGGVAADFKDVNFAAVYHWLRVEIREGAGFRELSYSALPSVPYAEVSYNTSPVGSVMPFAGTADKVPAGWRLCNGDPVEISDYPALFEVIGFAWGGNGSKFNLPDKEALKFVENELLYNQSEINKLVKLIPDLQKDSENLQSEIDKRCILVE